jgi:hypothetical protein
LLKDELQRLTKEAPAGGPIQAQLNKLAQAGLTSGFSVFRKIDEKACGLFEQNLQKIIGDLNERTTVAPLMAATVFLSADGGGCATNHANDPDPTHSS